MPQHTNPSSPIISNNRAIPARICSPLDLNKFPDKYNLPAIAEVGRRQWGIRELKRLLEVILPGGGNATLLAFGEISERE